MSDWPSSDAWETRGATAPRAPGNSRVPAYARGVTRPSVGSLTDTPHAVVEEIALNTGSFETDLRGLSAGIAGLYSDPHRRQLIGELVHAAGRNPRAA